MVCMRKNATNNVLSYLFIAAKLQHFGKINKQKQA